jgi:D-lactate dehydrogenase
VKVSIFSAKPHDRRFLIDANERAGNPCGLIFFEALLEAKTGKLVPTGSVVCAFVNDQLDRGCLKVLAENDVHLVVLRCAGFNNVDLLAASELGIAIGRVPAYSPHAVAEHAVALILSLNRHIHRAYARVREGNFALDGLLGFDLAGRTVGVVGTGKVGLAFARIMQGFGCRLLGSDPQPAEEFISVGGQYVDLKPLLADSDIVSLHCPLSPSTHHLIDAKAVALLKRGAMLINTSRGAIVDSQAMVAGLKSGAIGYLGLDVYEEEADLFFEDLSNQVIQDDVFARLLTFPNVLITGHQAFFTVEALTAIADTTIGNINQFIRSGRPNYPVTLDKCVAGPGAQPPAS